MGDRNRQLGVERISKYAEISTQAFDDCGYLSVVCDLVSDLQSVAYFVFVEFIEILNCKTPDVEYEKVRALNISKCSLSNQRGSLCGRYLFFTSGPELISRLPKPVSEQDQQPGESYERPIGEFSGPKFALTLLLLMMPTGLGAIYGGRFSPPSLCTGCSVGFCLGGL